MYLSGSFVLKAWFFGNLRLYHGSLRGKRDVLKLTPVSLCTAPRSTLCSQDFSRVNEETLEVGAVPRRRDKRTPRGLECKTTRSHEYPLGSLVQQVLTVSRILGQSMVRSPYNCRQAFSSSFGLFSSSCSFSSSSAWGVGLLRFFERLCYDGLSWFF